MIRISIAVVLVLGSTLTAQQPYGPGAPGTGGVTPTLACGHAWMGNASFALSVQGVIDLVPPNFFLLAPLALSGPAGSPGAGAAGFPIPLGFPPSPALAGLAVYAQVVVLDFPTAGSPAASRGLRIELGLPPLVFIGTSVGGSADPGVFVDPLALVLTAQTPGGVDNSTDGVFAHGGKDLYVGSSITNTVRRADTTVNPPAWSTLYTSAGNGCYGAAHDPWTDRLYTLTNPGTTGAQELVALDANPASPGYGQRIGSTTGVGSGLRMERWGLSPSGRCAALVSGFTTALNVVDTDPASPTYLQRLVAAAIPVDFPGQLIYATEVAFTPDDRIALVLISSGEIARFQLDQSTWIDHDPNTPGIQNLSGLAVPPVALGGNPQAIEVSADGRFAIVCGGGGRVGRLDFDPANPAAYAWTVFSPGVTLSNCYDVDLSPDGVVTLISYTPGAGQAVLLDATLGTLRGTVGLGTATTNIYALAGR